MSDLGNGEGGSRLSRVVVTGPIGSGKSAVAAQLRQRGATVIDADTVGHAVLGPGGEAFATVAARWPSVVVDGDIDRSRLAAIVFADRTQLEALQALTHPAIVARIEAAVGDAGEVVAVEMPLLDPPLRWHRLVVLAPTSMRFWRAVRRGMDPEDVTRRMRIQPQPAAWRAAADSVIDNDGDQARIGAAVDAWWRRWIDGAVEHGEGAAVP
ncbi:MAG: dephospho-CoA kinase [Actinomycetota bacterium]|nr:dephospho-CoA kinase [Actinomycetota bacterium]